MLFTTDLPEGRLELADVIICEKHVLKSFHLINLSDESLCVHLRTDLGPDQMVFQLENPNYTDNKTPDTYNEVLCYERVSRGLRLLRRPSAFEGSTSQHTECVWRAVGALGGGSCVLNDSCSTSSTR